MTIVRPLEGIVVLAIEQFGAGPWATLQLADLGARVIKIEDPNVGGDVGRYVPPFQSDEDSLFFQTFNRNKESVSLDLRVPEGQAVFHELVRHADVVFSNLRGNLAPKLGLTFDELSQVNSGIVCCSLSGFGNTGPRADQGGYDYVIQAMAGWMSITGSPESPPTRSGPSLVDLSAGYVAAIAILAGLRRSAVLGIGCNCDISLFETALAELAYVATWVATADYQPVRHEDSAHPSMIPFQLFKTADSWIVVAAVKEKLWRELALAVGRADLIDDPRFIDFAAREQHRQELIPLLRERFREKPTSVWIDDLSARGVPCGPVNSVKEALADQQTIAREDIVDVLHPGLGRILQVASPLRIDGIERPVHRAPSRGEQTVAILSDLCGLSDERIAEIAASGALGTQTSASQPSTSYRIDVG